MASGPQVDAQNSGLTGVRRAGAVSPLGVQDNQCSLCAQCGFSGRKNVESGRGGPAACPPCRLGGWGRVGQGLKVGVCAPSTSQGLCGLGPAWVLTGQPPGVQSLLWPGATPEGEGGAGGGRWGWGPDMGHPKEA